LGSVSSTQIQLWRIQSINYNPSRAAQNRSKKVAAPGGRSGPDATSRFPADLQCGFFDSQRRWWWWWWLEEDDDDGGGGSNRREEEADGAAAAVVAVLENPDDAAADDGDGSGNGNRVVGGGGGAAAVTFHAAAAAQLGSLLDASLCMHGQQINWKFIHPRTNSTNWTVQINHPNNAFCFLRKTKQKREQTAGDSFHQYN
jgi:hypothetical protein